MTAPTGAEILKKNLRNIGVLFAVLMGTLTNFAAFSAPAEEDPRIEAFFWKSEDVRLGARLNFKISYYGKLLSQVCSYPVNRSINAVVVYKVGELSKSEIKPLEVNCSFDGPPKSASFYDYRFKLSEKDELFRELLTAKENGVHFEIELAFVDAYGNWDSLQGSNYHVHLIP